MGFVIDGTDHVANSYQVNQNLPFKYNKFLSTLAVFEEKRGICWIAPVANVILR